ncbi:dihydroxyacetone kinase subunit DhaL [Enterococcus hirae]|nr:dihydroxyacetone kinase subunit DhaL [Enterococcus hirae]
MGMSGNDCKRMVEYVANQLIANEGRLGEIDQKIGDGDHGIGMANGAKAILKTLEGLKDPTPFMVFKDAGMAMMESMGGASGIIFSALFLGLAKTAKSSEAFSGKEFLEGIRAAVASIQKRGKAALGDKTMLDALIPAERAMEHSQKEAILPMLEQAVPAAYAGVEKTKEYPAKFGRAKFLGDRTIGYQDAGATSVALILESMKNYLEGAEK